MWDLNGQEVLSWEVMFKMRSGWQEVNTRDTVYGNEDSSTKETKWVKEQNKVLCDQSTGDKEDKEWYHI